MTVHQRAREAAMPVECKKDVLKQNQDGTWKLTLTIAPDGLPDEIMRAMPGTRYQTVFVEVGDDEQPVAKALPAASDKPRKPFHGLPLSQQAGIRCAAERFGHFLCERWPDEWASMKENGISEDEFVLRLLYKICNILSRKELDDEQAPVPRKRWMALNAEYEVFAGLAAEDRT